MSVKKNNAKQETLLSEGDKFTEDKEEKYDDIITQITSQLQTALILYKTKTGNNGDPDVADLSFNQNWEIKENKKKNAPKKGPIDILGHIEDINILDIKNQLYKIINESEIVEANDKQHLKDGIDGFIREYFFSPRRNLKSKIHLPHKAFHIFYSKVAAEQTDLDAEGQRLYRDICLSLANLLFEKDNEHLKEWGEKKNSSVVKVKEGDVELPKENIKPEDLVELPNGAIARFKDDKGVDKQKTGEQEVVIIVKTGNNSKEKKIPVRVTVENGTFKVKEKHLIPKAKEGDVELPKENIKPEDLVQLPNGAIARFEYGKGVDKEKKGEQKVVIIVKVGNNGKEKKIPVKVTIENGKIKVKDWPPTHYNFVNEQGQITQKGVQYIGQIFSTTIDNIPKTRDPKQFHEIFHDGDFNFLSRKDSAGNPIIGTLDLYIRAIMYLIKNSFNAYEEGGEIGARERYIARKGFLNKLYNTFQLGIEYNKLQEISDKRIIHDRLAEIWMSNQDNMGKDWKFVSRLKTPSSKLLKIGGRTNDINDESGVRAMYYGDMQDTDGIKESIIRQTNGYFSEVSDIPGLYIQQITSARKGNSFINPENENLIKKDLSNIINQKIEERKQRGKKKSQLEYISSKYQRKHNEKPSPGLQQAYRIASGEIKRGSNGNYTDFKLCPIFSYKADEYNKWVSKENRIQKDGILKQEVSYYPKGNDLNMGNHQILDLEKTIYSQALNVDAHDVKKSISLDKLRRFTEIAIKDMSFEINDLNEQIKAGNLPNPGNDDYKYLSIGDKKVSLEGLIWRNQNNTDRFDTLISMILNYFITHNKILYILPQNMWLEYDDDELLKKMRDYTSNGDFNTANKIAKEMERREILRKKGVERKNDTGISEEQLGLITEEQLHDKKALRERRFTTSDLVRKCALDFDFTNYCIGSYTPDNTRLYHNFYVTNLGKLRKFIKLEKKD